MDDEKYLCHTRFNAITDIKSVFYFALYVYIHGCERNFIMSHVKIHAGICGFSTTVNALSDDNRYAHLLIDSECPNFTALKMEFKVVDAYRECFGKIGEGLIYRSFQECCPHGACPVPCGVIKAIEVACGFALAQDVVIEISM